MRRSQLFVKTRKEAPADEAAKNAQLLIRAGYVYKEMAGAYTYLPLGLKVLNKIADIVREEMNKIGGQEVLMPALQVKERYEKTGRWDDKVVDDWFKTKLVNGTELGLGFSHEENLSPLLKTFVNSYKDLPISIYQIQTKFRNELRPKSGLMRGREFLMKDMYSFAVSQKDHERIYEECKQAYINIFDRLGIGDKTFITTASGGSFSKYSHEFQTLSDAGEDIIYLDRKKKVAINKEVFTDEVIKDLGLVRDELEEVKSIEVGNIFNLSTKFSEPFNLTAIDEDGKNVTLIMGCYGIGIGRAVGTIAELLSDEKGLVWPSSVAPFAAYLARIGDSEEVVTAADELYGKLNKQGIEVLYDDRAGVSAGEMFADADLMGMPHRVVISQKTLSEGSAELKKRLSDETELVALDKLAEAMAKAK
jgi:prolyl-tRNA synthetase